MSVRISVESLSGCGWNGCPSQRGIRTSEKVVGYDVEYRLGEKVGQVRMDRQPGSRIPVRNGQLVLAGEAQETASR